MGSRLIFLRRAVGFDAWCDGLQRWIRVLETRVLLE